MVNSGIRDGDEGDICLSWGRGGGQWNGLGENRCDYPCNLWSLIAISPFLFGLNGLSGEYEKDNEILSRGIKEVVGNCKIYLQKWLVKITTIMLVIKKKKNKNIHVSDTMFFTTYGSQVISNAKSLSYDLTTTYDFYLCIGYNMLLELLWKETEFNKYVV